MGPNSKLPYEPGMSPEEMSDAFSKAMAEEHAAMMKLPKVFKEGDLMMEEVEPNDDALGFDVEESEKED